MEMCRSKWLTVLSLVSLTLFSTVRSMLPPAAAAARQIPVRAGAPFRIALLADLHFGEAASTDWGPLQDLNSTTVINTVLHHEAPG